MMTMKALVLCVLLALSCAQESSGSDDHAELGGFELVGNEAPLSGQAERAG